MRREALTLVFAMIAGTVSMAACEKQPPQPKTAQLPAPAAAPEPTGAGTAQPQVAPTAVGSKDGQPPAQGQVDPKHPPQQRDFQTR
jgi:hypothetical protein